MNCLICKDLKRVFEDKRSDYVEARCAAYYRVSTEFAAYKNVDMERAKSALEDHQSVCVAAAASLLKLNKPMCMQNPRKPEHVGAGR